MSLEVKIFPKGPLSENTYLVRDEATGCCAVIDPGYIGTDITDAIGEASNLKYTMLTHGHFDHYYSADKYKEQFPDVRLVAPEKDAVLMEADLNAEFAAMGIKNIGCPKVDIRVNEGDEIHLGESVFTFIDTPGHTAGGTCICSDGILFSGDTLFKLSVGNTSFATGDWPSLMKSIQTRLYELDEDIVVYPGHGEPTTIGYEKRFNPFV